MVSGSNCEGLERGVEAGEDDLFIKMLTGVGVSDLRCYLREKLDSYIFPNLVRRPNISKQP